MSKRKVYHLECYEGKECDECVTKSKNLETSRFVTSFLDDGTEKTELVFKKKSKLRFITHDLKKDWFVNLPTLINAIILNQRSRHISAFGPNLIQKFVNGNGSTVLHVALQEMLLPQYFLILFVGLNIITSEKLVVLDSLKKFKVVGDLCGGEYYESMVMLEHLVIFKTPISPSWKNACLLTLNLSHTIFHNCDNLIRLLTDVLFDHLTYLDVGHVCVVDLTVAHFVVARFMQLTTIKFKGKRRDQLFCAFLNGFQCVNFMDIFECIICGSPEVMTVRSWLLEDKYVDTKCSSIYSHSGVLSQNGAANIFRKLDSKYDCIAQLNVNVKLSYNMITEMVSCFPCIRVLQLGYRGATDDDHDLMDTVSDYQIIEISRICSTLAEFFVGQCALVTTNGLVPLLDKNLRLTHVSLVNCCNLTRSALIHIETKFPSIEFNIEFN
jgi:hypothetical protein